MSVAVAPFEPIIVRPRRDALWLLLTATQPISHHDAAVQDDSNRQLFNRQKQRVDDIPPAVLPTQAQIDRFAALWPVPGSLLDWYSDLSLPEFLATALMRTFLDLHNRGEGEGLFTGLDRYARLEARVNQAATGVPTLRGWWARLARLLGTDVHGGEHDAALLSLLMVPRALQQLALAELVDQTRTMVSLGREWHNERKLQSEAYAAKSGRQAVAAGDATLSFCEGDLTPSARGTRVLEVPAVSVNALRHQIAREPAWLHLSTALGLTPDRPGRGLLPPGAEAIFYNGGNIRSGAKQPSNAFDLAQVARGRYPTLDLLGGVCDSFDVGESRLQMGAWLVCRENRTALADTPAGDLPDLGISALDMLDDVTHTRQAGQTGVGQMIHSFETLCVGAQIAVRLSLSPFTHPLTVGALAAAVDTYFDCDSTVGGQAARGFGAMRGRVLTPFPEAEQRRRDYEAYLLEHQDALRAGIVDGTLGTGAVVLS